MNRGYIRTLGILFLATLLVFTACTPAPTALPETPEIAAEATEPSAAEVAVIKVGVIAPRLASLPMLVAAEDFLAPEGIVIQWVYFQSDGAIAQANASGAVDMVVSNPLRAEQLNEAGGNVRIFSVAWGTLDWLLVANDSIQSFKDLSGKVIGISSPGSTTDVLTRLMLEKRGISIEDDNIEIAAIGGTAARAGALSAGRIDVAWVGFDAAYELLQQEGFHVLEDLSVPDEFPGYVSISWSAKKDYIDSHLELIQKITEAQIKANRWAQDKDAFIERAKTSVISFLSEQTEEQISWSYDRYIDVGMFPVNGGVTPEAMDVTMEIGLLATSIEKKPNYDEIAMDEFQKNVLKELGEW